MVTGPVRHVRPPVSDDLAAARDAVLGRLMPTPVMPIAIGYQEAWLKLETLQPTGSFKVRGAVAAMSRIEPGQRVLAVSAGNHALGIAWASSRLRVPATVVLAETASPAKLEALRQFPIELVIHGETYDEAETHALALAAGMGSDVAFISAYNDPLVIAGQSTLLDEIVAAGGDEPITVVVPTGGGGLLAGVAIRAAELAMSARDIRVIGVEAERSRAVSRAIAAGHTVSVDVGDTIADGLSGNLEPGSVTIDVLRQHPVTMTSVSEIEIRTAIRHLATNAGIVAEGAGAAAVAAALSGKVDVGDTRMVLIVSGRNIALSRLVSILGSA